MNLVFYLSDHGFGHMSRNISVIASVIRRYDASVYIVCGKRQLEFAKDVLRTMVDEEQCSRIIYREEHTDIGLVLHDGTLDVDAKKLADVCDMYVASIPERSHRELQWLKDNCIDAALCDMPVWAIKACDMARVPMLYVGNFTWVELYREFLPDRITDVYEAYYKLIRHALILPFHTEEMLSVIDNARIKETGLLSRPFNEEKICDIRNGINSPIVFVSIGMSAHFNTIIDVDNVDAFFITTEGVPLSGNNVMVIGRDTINTQDYIKAADYVISKAGWGTVSECVLAGKPMALFRRDGVLEDRNTIRQLCDRNMAISVTQDDLCNMNSVIEHLKQLDEDCFEGFYDAADEVADELVSIIG